MSEPVKLIYWPIFQVIKVSFKDSILKNDPPLKTWNEEEKNSLYDKITYIEIDFWAGSNFQDNLRSLLKTDPAEIEFTECMCSILGSISSQNAPKQLLTYVHKHAVALQNRGTCIIDQEHFYVGGIPWTSITWQKKKMKNMQW